MITGFDLLARTVAVVRHIKIRRLRLLPGARRMEFMKTGNVLNQNKKNLARPERRFQNFFAPPRGDDFRTSALISIRFNNLGNWFCGALMTTPDTQTSHPSSLGKKEQSPWVFRCAKSYEGFETDTGLFCLSLGVRSQFDALTYMRPSADKNLRCSLTVPSLPILV